MFLTEKRLIALSLGMAFEVETHLFCEEGELKTETGERETWLEMLRA